MLSITDMANDLSQYTAMQITPMPIYREDYIKIVSQAVKKYFVDVNHPDEYSITSYINEGNNIFYDYDFNVLQEEYIFILSKIRFKRMIMADQTGDGAISYTTDALSVTGAKEGYKSVQAEIDDLERERIRVFHKIMAHE